MLGFYTVNELTNLERDGHHVTVAADPREDHSSRSKKPMPQRNDRYFGDFAQSYMDAEDTEADYYAGMWDAHMQQSDPFSAQTDTPIPLLNGAKSQIQPDEETEWEPQQPIVVDDGPNAERWPVVKFSHCTVMLPPMGFEVQSKLSAFEAFFEAG